MEKKRINLIDTWRGIAIVSMVLYHFLYDLKFIFNLDMEFFTIEKWYPFQQFICWSFIFLAGFSHNLSKNPLKNAGIILLAALGLTVATRIFDPTAYIRFGVFHLIGTSMLIVGLFQKILPEPKKGTLVFAILSFGIFFYLWKYGLEGFSFYETLAAKKNLYPLGFTGPGFVSTDYFPILPWFFLYLTGFFVGYYHKYKRPFLRKIDLGENPLGNLGRHSFLIYLIHQPISLGILYLLRFLGAF